MKPNLRLTGQPLALILGALCGPLYKPSHGFIENQLECSDYYGEILRHHPEVNPETLIKFF